MRAFMVGPGGSKCVRAKFMVGDRVYIAVKRDGVLMSSYNSSTDRFGDIVVAWDAKLKTIWDLYYNHRRGIFYWLESHHIDDIHEGVAEVDLFWTPEECLQAKHMLGELTSADYDGDWMKVQP